MHMCCLPTSAYPEQLFFTILCLSHTSQTAEEVSGAGVYVSAHACTQSGVQGLPQGQATWDCLPAGML